MFIYRIKIIFVFILISVFILSSFQGLTTNTSNIFVQAGEQQVLEAELEKLLKQITQYEQNIEKTEKEKQTLRNQISILRNRIGKLDAQVRQGNIVIRDLNIQIKNTELSIKETSLKIEDSRERLAAILRAINREYQYSFTEVFLAGETLSDFFNNLTALETLNIENKRILGEIESLKVFLGEQKELAQDEKEAVGNIVAIQLLQREEGDRIKREQERLHRMTEAEYQQYLKEKADAEKRVTEIRARIIELVGIPDAAQFSFGELLDIAKVVERQTGIRPAFLLAIITQESSLGRNVGQCHIADKVSGASVHIRRGTRFANGLAVPPRSKRNDLAKFLKLTNELGLDPLKTPISCPIVGIPGFGGAMGPAQFIPTTWAERRHILEPFVDGVPNPWNVNHAFLASALYLRDLGGRTNERRAALRYFAGGNWANPRFAFYGDQVVRRINCMQTFIDHGTITPACERMIFIPR
jgi:membrane-bound lytic murein transglycosylase B